MVLTKGGYRTEKKPVKLIPGTLTAFKCRYFSKSIKQLNKFFDAIIYISGDFGWNVFVWLEITQQNTSNHELAMPRATIS